MSKNNLYLALSIVIATIIIVSGYKYRFSSTKGITVVGMAQIDFTSDLIVWEASFNRKSKDLKLAYANIKKDESIIKDYLRIKGIPDTSVEFGALEFSEDFEEIFGNNGVVMARIFSGYILNQKIKIESDQISKVELLSKEVSELIEKGVQLNSIPPRYYYRKLSDLKMDLLSQASADGKRRAEFIAKSAGTEINELKKAIMGVFQITGRNSNEEYSYGGSYNTSERNKTANITIKMEYEIK